MATIMEALQNAKYNIITNHGVAIAELIGRDQLNNAVSLLEKGYALNDQVEPLFDKYENLENIPEK